MPRESVAAPAESGEETVRRIAVVTAAAATTIIAFTLFRAAGSIQNLISDRTGKGRVISIATAATTAATAATTRITTITHSLSTAFHILVFYPWGTITVYAVL
ncbi:hypothetical protein [Ligaoa zhengdingensis]|uniref:hypothetical protein n=1 Tax=Ligaoa zhengdingensis TaxID=2763658 RepID=UPI0031BB5AA2